MTPTDAPAPAAGPLAPRRARRRWPWLLLAAALLLAGGLLAREGWGYRQESAARRALADERFDEARDHVESALRVRGRSPEAHLLAARIARQRGAYAEAEGHLARCGEVGGMTEPLQLEWLLLRCQRGEVDEVAAGLLALVERGHPESPAILEALSAVYMRQTRYLEAVRCLDRWVALAPDSARALDWRGWVNNQLDQRAEAIRDYEQCLARRPGRSAVRLRLAEILVESSRPAEAVPHLERLRDEQPDNPDVLVYLARCRAADGHGDEARALLDEVLSTHADHFDALLQRGKLDHGEGKYADAERWLRKAVARSPRDPEARYALYLALQGQPGRGEDARAELARWEEDRKARARLVRLLRTELDERPRDAALAAEAGELFLGQGEDEKGLSWLRRALALDPGNAAARRALAAYSEAHPGAGK